MDRIEELLNAPYWIIDVLPMRVPEESPGQFFAVEKYFLKEQKAAVRQKHINLILKLNCYMDISVDGEINPAPDQMAEMMKERAVCILLGDAMILSEPDDLHMTLFHPDAQLLELVKALSTGEGLFVWKSGVERIIASCGNDCAACPRYVTHPYEKTEDELDHTAELWQKIGYRDHLASIEEISCTGCKPENWCRYHVVKCCEGRSIATCGQCTAYPCERIKKCFAVTKSFEPVCRSVCTEEEYEQLRKAFFEKEKNLGE